MATHDDGSGPGHRAHREAEAKTEALTPERRAELMAAAEAQYRKDSRVGRPTGSQPAVSINTARNKVEPLSPEVKTESGRHSPLATGAATPLPAAQLLRPAVVDDRTEAISREDLRRRLRDVQSQASDTDSLPRHEAGFDAAPAPPAGPGLEPTLAPAPPAPPQTSQEIAVQADAFEADATMAHVSGVQMLAPDRTADGGASTSAPSGQPASAAEGPPVPPPPDQPAWLGKARPVDLQRPPSGAPSAFGDVATGLEAIPLPPEADPVPSAATVTPGLGEVNDTALMPPLDSEEAPVVRGRGCGGTLAMLGGFAVVGVLVGSGVAAWLFSPQLMALIDGEPLPEPTVGLGAEGAPHEGAGPSGQAVEAPTEDASLNPLRIAVVDDLTETGYGLGQPFRDTVVARLRALGPYREVPAADATAAAGAGGAGPVEVSLFLKKISVVENDEEQVATAWCATSVSQPPAATAPTEPAAGPDGEKTPAEGEATAAPGPRVIQLKATETWRGATPDVDEALQGDALADALHPHRYRAAGAAALACADTLAELVHSELNIEGPPAVEEPTPIALPAQVPPRVRPVETAPEPEAEVTAPEPTPPDDKQQRRRKKSRRSKRRR